jgi:hypothetical protein
VNLMPMSLTIAMSANAADETKPVTTFGPTSRITHHTRTTTMNIRHTVRAGIVASLVTLTIFVSWALIQPAAAHNAPLAPTIVTPTPLPQTGDGQPVSTSQRPAAETDNGPDARNTANTPTLAFSYYRLLGTAFNVRTSTTTIAYYSNGCIYLTGGTDDRLVAPLLIPDGSVIKFLRIYYNDTSATNDLTAWITRYQPGLANADLTSVNSITNTGYGTAVSPEITETVDLTNWAYTIIVAPNTNAATNSICGIHVTYYAPSIFGAFLPVVRKP